MNKKIRRLVELIAIAVVAFILFPGTMTSLGVGLYAIIT